MKTKERLIADAEESLGIDIHETDTGRTCYYADETNEWYWLTVKDLEIAQQFRDRDGYSEWCAYTGRPMSKRAVAKHRLENA